MKRDPDEPMLTVKDFGSDLFGPVDLELRAGECVTIEGPSGAGKSLLLRGLADLDVTDGYVAFGGRRREEFRPETWRRTVAYLPAESGWWADLVGEHFVGDLSGAFETMAAALGLDRTVLQWRVDRLSSGERHRLALVRTLLLEPRVLLLDEPTASLDKKSVERVEDLILATIADGAAALVVTHDDDQPHRLNARRLRMESGRLVGECAA